jgi:hypothetical protein
MSIGPTSDSLPSPARPEKLTVQFFAEGDRLAVQKKTGNAPVFFLLLWLIAWTVGCVALAVNVIAKPQLGLILFGIPFWASWLLVAGFLVWIFFGSEMLVLTPEGAYFRRTALVNLSSRFVPRNEILAARECLSTWQENDHYLWGIELQTAGKSLPCFFRLPDAERYWLIAELNRFLGVNAPNAASQPVLASGNPSAALAYLSTPSNVEILKPDPTASLPSDSTWTLDEGLDGYVARQSGRWQIASVLGGLFICLFWNGIVSVFVLILFGGLHNQRPMGRGEWWGLFFFLIPFEVIGAIMLFVFVAMLLEPWRRTEWWFTREQISRRYVWPVIRFTKVWPVNKLSRLELRTGKPNPTGLTRKTQPSLGSSNSLTLVTPENVDLCQIDNLTIGEARWFAQVLRERRPEWFER